MLIGLLLLVAAAVVGAVGVATNVGTTDALATSFNIFGFQIAGPSGWLFLDGIVVGGVGMVGVGLLYEDLFRRFDKWRELRETRRETKDLREQNEQLFEQLDTERDETVRAGAAGDEDGPSQAATSQRARRLRLPGRRR